MREENRVGGLPFYSLYVYRRWNWTTFERPKVGGAIGMGIGFLIMALIRVKTFEPSPITIQIPKDIYPNFHIHS